MAIEIVDFPINSTLIFHSYVSHYQSVVYSIHSPYQPVWTLCNYPFKGVHNHPQIIPKSLTIKGVPNRPRPCRCTSCRESRSIRDIKQLRNSWRVKVPTLEGSTWPKASRMVLQGAKLRGDRSCLNGTVWCGVNDSYDVVFNVVMICYDM